MFLHTSLAFFREAYIFQKTNNVVGAETETQMHGRLQERPVRSLGGDAELVSQGWGEEGFTNGEKGKMKRKRSRVKSLAPETNIKNCSGAVCICSPLAHSRLPLSAC